MTYATSSASRWTGSRQPHSRPRFTSPSRSWRTVALTIIFDEARPPATFSAPPSRGSPGRHGEQRHRPDLRSRLRDRDGRARPGNPGPRSWTSALWPTPGAIECKTYWALRSAGTSLSVSCARHSEANEPSPLSAGRDLIDPQPRLPPQPATRRDAPRPQPDPVRVTRRSRAQPRPHAAGRTTGVTACTQRVPPTGAITSRR
jgi:hypothetical protein